MGDYIDDFQKSDAPQFKGKSKEKRKDMAIAAYLDKNEEVDMDIYHLDEKIAGLVTKAKKSGMPYSILKKVYDRGMAAYKTGHRPGTTAQQWAFARVNSFTTKSSGTWGKADKDLAKQVRGENVNPDAEAKKLINKNKAKAKAAVDAGSASVLAGIGPIESVGMIPKKKRKGHEVLGPESVQEWFESNQTRAKYQLRHGEDWWWKLQEVKESMLEKIGADCCDDCSEELKEEMTSEDSLKNWKYEDAKGYAEKLIDEYGQPDEVTETMLKWNKLGSFGKDERETYIIDESIPHAFPKPHKDYVYTVMNIKIPSDMLDTLGHVTGSIIYDGLKEEVTARCGSLYANAATMGFVRDMVDGKVPVEDGPAKDEYADRITKDPLPKFYDNKMNEGVEHMCGHCLDESLWANIHKKRQRIKGGSGEKMRKKGEKGAPTPTQMKRAKSEEALKKVKGTNNLYEPKTMSKSARMRSMIDFLNTQQKKNAEKKKKTKNTSDYKMRMYNSMENMWGEVTEKAEYQGRSVELNNPTQGDIKKYKVYVKNDKGNVVKVEFGDPNMSIKRDDPEARKAFRARHNCDQKKDKTTAGYWSCKFWSTKSVSDLMKG